MQGIGIHLNHFPLRQIEGPNLCRIQPPVGIHVCPLGKQQHQLPDSNVKLAAGMPFQGV